MRITLQRHAAPLQFLVPQLQLFARFDPLRLGMLKHFGTGRSAI